MKGLSVGAALVLLMAANPAPAQDAAPPPSGSQAEEQALDRTPETDAEAKSAEQLGSALVGRDAQSSDGQPIGTVAGVQLAEDGTLVAAAIIGPEEPDVALIVPWYALDVESDGTVTVALTKKELDGVPVLDPHGRPMPEERPEPAFDPMNSPDVIRL